MYGLVLDEDGDPIVGANVTLDGNAAASDSTGRFQLPVWASGEPLLIVERPGFVAYRESLAPNVGRDASQPALATLQRGGRLELAVPAVAGGGEVLVFLLPSGGQRLTGKGGPQPAFPWHRLNPLRVVPGSLTVLEDLPATKYDIVAFSALAKSQPDFVWVLADKTASVALSMVPTEIVRGQILRDGKGLSSASITLRTENVMRSTQGALGAAGRFYKSQPMELLPQALQSTRTDSDGHFTCGWGR